MTTPRTRSKRTRETSDEVSSAAGRLRVLRRNHKSGRFQYVMPSGITFHVHADVMACVSSAHNQDQTRGRRRKPAGRRSK